MTALDHNTGIEVFDLQSDTEFQARQMHAHDAFSQFSGMQRLAETLASAPDRVLQELSELAVCLCGADSAGVSLETENAGERVFQWAATSGAYAPFLDAMLPYTWMPCGVTLDRGTPQLVRVPVDHFEAMGVDGVAAVTDGMLIPWKVGTTRGTVWILAHGRTTAFDSMDLLVMEGLANFAAMAVRHEQQQKLLVEQAEAASAASMAHNLAHQINNPLQKITNSVFLAATDAPDAQMHVKQAAEDLRHLSVVVQQLLVVSDISKKLQ